MVSLSEFSARKIFLLRQKTRQSLLTTPRSTNRGDIQTSKCLHPRVQQISLPLVHQSEKNNKRLQTHRWTCSARSDPKGSSSAVQAVQRGSPVIRTFTRISSEWPGKSEKKKRTGLAHLWKDDGAPVLPAFVRCLGRSTKDVVPFKEAVPDTAGGFCEISFWR